MQNIKHNKSPGIEWCIYKISCRKTKTKVRKEKEILKASKKYMHASNSWNLFVFLFQLRWSAKDKVKEYELCLQTAMISRSHLADTLSKKELKARSSAIMELGDTLIKKLRKAEELDSKYQRLQDKQIKHRNSINMVNIKYDIIRISWNQKSVDLDSIFDYKLHILNTQNFI